MLLHHLIEYFAELSLFDDKPRTLSPRDVMLLGHMADEVMQAARQQAAKAPDAAPPAAS